MKRKIAISVIGLLAIVVSGVAFLYFTRPEADAISPASCAKIKKGMAREEVEAILGGPATRPTIKRFWVFDVTIFDDWVGKRGIICVEFEPPGLVKAATFAPTFSPQETSLLDRLRTWLGW